MTLAPQIGALLDLAEAPNATLGSSNICLKGTECEGYRSCDAMGHLRGPQPSMLLLRATAPLHRDGDRPRSPAIAHGRAKPLQQLIQTMLLPADWDVQGLQNVVPACRPCNGKKRDLVARPQHVMYLLTIAEGRLARVRELAARYTRQAGADNLRTLIEHALAGGLVWDDFAPGRGSGPRRYASREDRFRRPGRQRSQG